MLGQVVDAALEPAHLVLDLCVGAAERADRFGAAAEGTGGP